MTSTQLFWLSAMALAGGIVLLALTDQTEMGASLIVAAITGSIGAHRKRQRAKAKAKAAPAPKRPPRPSSWLLLATLVLLGACTAPDRLDVAADRARHRAFTERWLPVLTGVAPPLDAEQQQDARDFAEAWGLELAAREARAR